MGQEISEGAGLHNLSGSPNSSLLNNQRGYSRHQIGGLNNGIGAGGMVMNSSELFTIHNSNNPNGVQPSATSSDLH